jgi:hypothetical protein
MTRITELNVLERKKRIEAVSRDQYKLISMFCRLANKQLSGAQKVKIDLIDYLFKPGSYSHRFSFYPIRLDTYLEVTD